MYEVDQYTVSLLHFDDGIKDECGKVWTANGGASTSTTQSKLGSSSLYLNGAQSLTTPANADFNFGSGDFTIDWWEYRITNEVGVCVFDTDGNIHGCPGIVVGYGGNGVKAYLSSTASEYDIGGKTMGNAILNVWTHYALVRSGSTFYTFQNGVQQATWTSNLSVLDSVNPAINRYNASAYNASIYIDEFRISKGIARWTSNFTPDALQNIAPPTQLVATVGDSQVTLSWNAVTEATGYNIKRSTTAGGPYTTIATNVTGASYVDNTVTNGTTYYYVVTALNGTVESANSNEASATPQAPSGHGLLRITMNDSSEREYQLTHDEINKFIVWCDRTVGTGGTLYVFDKTYNVGEFKNRKEYVLFEKIISFEVMELTK